MVLSSLTFNSGDITDPVQARTAIEAYDQEWRKYALYKVHGMAYNPNWEMFKEMKRLDMLVTVGGFNKDNELKAFYVGTKSEHPYNPEWVFAHNFMFYLAPEYRKTPWVFKKFIKAIEAEMKECKVDLYSIVLPYDERFEKAYKSVERNGFNREELTFFKRTS